MLLQINAEDGDQEDNVFDLSIYDSQEKYVASIKHNELITKPTKNYQNYETDSNSHIAAKPTELEQPRQQNENINIDIFDFDTCPQDDDQAEE